MLAVLNAPTASAKEPGITCAANNQYTVLALPLRPAAIADTGTVAGTTVNRKAASWTRNGGLHEIPLPPGFSDAEAVAINHRGHVIGNAHAHDMTQNQAFLYIDHKLTELTGQQTRAFSINDDDVIVGSALGTNGTSMQPVSWAMNVLRPLEPCCAGASKSINKIGIVVGELYDDKGQYHAFLWSKADGISQIGPVNRFSSAIAINNRGHVVIQAFSDIYLYADGNLARIALHPKHPSKPLAINDCDVVVGAYGPFSDADRAFIWDESSGFRDLNTLIPANSGWKLESATGINIHGMIVGRGDLRGKDDSGFALIPVR